MAETEIKSEVNENFPERTAGEITLPSGKTYWLQTLNDPQQRRVQDESAWGARRLIRKFRQGGENYEDLVEQFQNLDKAKQARYVAGEKGARGAFAFEAWEKFPDPRKPDGDTSEGVEAFEKKAKKWEKDVKKAQEDRFQLAQSLYEQEVTRAEGMTKAALLKACIEEWLETEFRKHSEKLQNYWTLRYAIRDVEDHSSFIFSDEDVETRIFDMDDAERNLLIQKYNELDSVRRRDIPTSPAES